MHIKPDLKVLYFGTPVVLIGTRNEDGTPNIAPMSSAWWLGSYAMLGMGNASQTHIDPIAWDPLIMKFCEFFGGGGNVYPSRLAKGWNMPHQELIPAA